MPVQLHIANDVSVVVRGDYKTYNVCLFVTSTCTLDRQVVGLHALGRHLHTLNQN